MKYFNKIWLGAFALSVLASCADNSPLDFSVEKPESITRLEYLDNYDVLKSYVNRSENPNFKLGVGVSVADYTATGENYSMITSNFDEMTAGWEMKHGGVVQDDGSLNTTDVVNFLSVAENAGLTVYGHTLCWHANQNAEYLNSTIAPTIIPGSGGPVWEPVTEIDFETDDASKYSGSDDAPLSFTADGEGKDGVGRALVVTNSGGHDEEWRSQFFVVIDPAAEEGDQFELTMDVKADVDFNIPTQSHVTAGDYIFYDFFGQVSASTDWTTFTKQITVTSDQVSKAPAGAIAFNLGKDANVFYFDNISVKKLNEDGGGPTWDLQEENDFESDGASNYQVTVNGQTTLEFTADGDGSAGTGRAIKVTNSAVGPDPWSCQLFFKFSIDAAEAGDQYELSMDIRSDADATVGTQAQGSPGGYLHWDLFGSPNFTSTWTNYTKTVTISAEQVGALWIAFNMGDVATSYYYDNVKITKYNPDGGSAQTIPKTEEERDSIITAQLDYWIAGMMEVTKDYVKAWDVVNEPMDDGSPYDLKTGEGKELKDDEFYWQDHMGEEYAVKAFEFARKYGNSDDILFINDYNLEYNIDKCKGLIQYVEFIESKGQTVDGIGTQMHISIDSDKDNIVEMFQLLAATGKLIKISELDIGIGVTTEEATDELYQQQAEMYQFVVEKYMELIPANQRYGITVWSPLDSSPESGWRANEPIGLWKRNYDRKRAYGGFADGLE